MAAEPADRAASPGGLERSGRAHPQRDEAAALHQQGLRPAEIAKAMGSRSDTIVRLLNVAAAHGEIDDDEPGDGEAAPSPSLEEVACAAHLADLRREHGEGARFEARMKPSLRPPLFVANGCGEIFWPRQYEAGR